MSTGTVQTAEMNVIRNITSDALQMVFTNDSGETLSEGQEVILKTNGKLDLREDGTEIPVGIVVIGGANGARVTVRLYTQMEIAGKAIGGALEEGTFVVPNGNVAAGVGIEYVAAAAADYVTAIVLKGGAENAAIRVGILNSPFQLDSDT